MRKDIAVQTAGGMGVLRGCLVQEGDLTEDEHRTIRELLVAAFPENAVAFSQVSYLGAKPEYRLWLEGPAGQMLAHLDFERRAISVGSREITVAGIGEVAVHPDLQRRGLGCLLMGELERVLHRDAPAPFGLLYCLEEVAGFYERIGWYRLYQPSVIHDAVTGERHEEVETTFVLPVLEPIVHWPREGVIDIRGLGW